MIIFNDSTMIPAWNAGNNVEAFYYKREYFRSGRGSRKKGEQVLIVGQIEELCSSKLAVRFISIVEYFDFPA